MKESRLIAGHCSIEQVVAISLQGYSTIQCHSIHRGRPKCSNSARRKIYVIQNRRRAEQRNAACHHIILEGDRAGESVLREPCHVCRRDKGLSPRAF